MNISICGALALRTRCATALLSVAVVVCISTTASAGIFNWGDLNDPAGDVMFLDVEEENGLADPLFAPPPGSGSPSAIGNSLVLDPQNFASLSSGGSHLVDSQLSTTLMVDTGDSINGVVIDEFGDYTLGGLAGGLATAGIGASFFWQILEIDGAAVSLPLETQNLSVSTGSGPNGGVYNRPGDDGIATPWQGSAILNVAGYLGENAIDGSATKISLILDNTLLTAAEPYSSAFIKKKGVAIDVIVNDPVHNVPEPMGVVLLGIGWAIVGCQRRRLR